jgi:hypothetical protein
MADGGGRAGCGRRRDPRSSLPPRLGENCRSHDSLGHSFVAALRVPTSPCAIGATQAVLRVALHAKTFGVVFVASLRIRSDSLGRVDAHGAVRALDFTVV